MSYPITLIPGDGIGPEVTGATRKCVDALDVDIAWDVHTAGETAYEQEGELLPAHTVEAIKKNKVALKGPITTPVGKGFRSINVTIRQMFDLFVCLRPVKSLRIPGVPFHDVDLVVMRENTEDLYSGVEFEAGSDEAEKLISTMNGMSRAQIRQGSALSIKPISRYASARIAKFACEYALKNKRKKVTCIHKANIMKCSDGLFLRTFMDVAKSYEEKIIVKDAIVDNLSMQLVKRPGHFDILVLPNLYGDIVSDLAAGLIGGLGLAAGANIGDEIAVFEPTHGSAPKYAGKNKVNPAATIFSAVLMLKHLGEYEKAVQLENATREVIEEGKSVTYDLKDDRDDPSAVSTDEMAQAICEKIKSKASA
ncbi:MAG: isocitrate/isopropylmalate dehydrogenase family protein [Candidatus Omnitrophica bacterium]|nr:isocitrate/isopropylmalate dehydrogenase family protein [Candidatus Omnitrophota bacterium]